MPIPLGLDQFYNLTHLNLSNSGFTGQVPVGISRLKRLVLLDLSILFATRNYNLKLENPNLRTLVRNLSELSELYLDGVNISMNGKELCQALSPVLPNLKVLSLQNCYLSGPFDSSLLKLGSLSELRLGQNNISAVNPEIFGSLSNLTLLHVSSCNLFGTFPKEIFELPLLRSLDISNNPLLQGSMPEFPQKGCLLEELVMADTGLFGKLPENIGSLSYLSTIDLGHSGFSGPIPPSMSKLTQLQYMDLFENNFTGQVPNLNLSKNLAYINLAHNRSTGSISSLQWGRHLKLVKLHLRNNSLSGTIPPILFTLPSLQKLDLSQNQFTGQLGEFFNQSSSVLDTLDLSNNRLEGSVPLSIFGLSSLQILAVSSNNFNGTLRLSMFQKLSNLSSLDLSGNKLWIISSGINSSLFPQIGNLNLASCNLTEFPRFLSNQSSLSYLDLSNNQIRGKIPNWIWKIGNGFIVHLNLSLNFLENPEQPLPKLPFKYLGTLDLHSNLLQGSLPILPPAASVIDYSYNKLTSMIPVEIGSYLHYAVFFSLSNNFLKGEIPMSVCEAIGLLVLDLSNNGLRGSIPLCLSSMELRVLRLRSNNLHGIIPKPFPIGCGLRTLDLNGNKVEGEISKSLSNCRMLEVLDLGNNQITGTFPSWLGELTNLRVLVLRSNKFYGHIGHLESNSTFNMFQIIDLSFNKFTGSLPAELFLKWKGMMTNNYNQQIMRFQFLQLSRLYYQDVVTVTNKGMPMELLKILPIFTSIDLSNNRFEGEIPQVIGDLTQLYVLNLSHNVLTGSIPSSLGNLKQLGSLDLSDNKLSGGIPKKLADLTFLVVLNLSFNQLVGRIPEGPQFQTYNNASFEGNNGLCGPPLSKTCRDDVKEVPSTTSDEDVCKFSLFKDCINGDIINWQLMSVTMGFGVGIGIAICIAVSWSAWNRLCITISKKILNMD
ncbi:Receptor-like protein [Thalictrum thalictroides]|uniref:Receptor-like protein n=1 Tax=Thalictrum thalictroides TaxID=46969 RepID=A0A7J6V346_THATH|nr:Receptor-like protein [Thalictrum thalictroides]